MIPKCAEGFHDQKEAITLESSYYSRICFPMIYTGSILTWFEIRSRSIAYAWSLVSAHWCRHTNTLDSYCSLLHSAKQSPLYQPLCARKLTLTLTLNSKVTGVKTSRHDTLNENHWINDMITCSQCYTVTFLFNYPGIAPKCLFVDLSK